MRREVAMRSTTYWLQCGKNRISQRFNAQLQAEALKTEKVQAEKNRRRSERIGVAYLKGLEQKGISVKSPILRRSQQQILKAEGRHIAKEGIEARSRSPMSLQAAPSSGRHVSKIKSIKKQKQRRRLTAVQLAQASAISHTLDPVQDKNG